MPAYKYFDRAWMNSTSTGTASTGIVLGTALSGYRTFTTAGLGNGETFRYTIIDGAAWEVGTAVYNAVTPSMSRTPDASSDGSAARINLSGSATIFIDAGAADLIRATEAEAETGTDEHKIMTPATVAAAVAAFSFATGTKMLFVQTNAPVGWTKDVDQSDKAIRLTSGTASTGGSSAFSTVFGKTTTDSTTLTSLTIPSHAHSDYYQGSSLTVGTASAGSAGGEFPFIYVSSVDITETGASTTTGSIGSGGGHTHPIDIRVQYVDVIKATKD